MAHSITKSGFQMATATSLHHNDKYQKQHFLIVMNLDCLSAIETIQNASAQNLFRSPYRWLVFYDCRGNETEHPAYQLLLSSPLLVSSDVTLARRLADDIFQLIEIHKPSDNESIVETARGWYNHTKFYGVTGPRELFRRRKNLMLHPLTMINVVVDSNSSIEHIPKEDRLEPHFDSLTKICWIIVHLGFQMLNATPRYTFASSFGYKNEFGQWNGAINLLMTHQGDLATSCLPTHDRSEVVTFTEMVAKTEVAFIFRQPPLSYVVSIYALPFSKNVWIASIVCIIVSGLTLFLATKWESNVHKSPTQPDGTLGDAFLLTMSAVCQQGCVLEPKKISGRMIVLFMFTALMALYAAYSANIVVLLRAPSHAITSLQKLYDSKITLAANDVDYNHFLLKVSNKKYSNHRET
ncbi:Glutamate receptor U1 [Eumeta japonica]|uniref:Glutamate receptor U1 n=1 Tax=Eumeta variegata TaxID=151549 RepID=A0A4C1VAF9_EUMVA|nr:Glutamate receptor U1 [Eumeta japonica]